ncbi:phosphonate metabolism protein/1,5-bisphosphokinase (PRPP-forming) PhnN [Roseomonas nepalensis]|uniref:Ribose 1,5-bisphosphate phosphokinase PhnN n=1 Tax=Muricoccus nepalensis TaxID=1854500 RepID=A0A502FFF8_9PROT|nr:phosphonate metabolism protein/1,5-bisphosphokinase (PRPP-forming) PhnN [Roseomonas nepalensis]TPG48104.1 phosphonate metabolism protein/1,5-bisphosphokinase (PRPP-forming) PhnN [Roseomonas nepalensis]
MSGVLVAVVGPSGAGKDTLMEAARAALARDDRVTFLQRTVTRPAEAGGEDHRPLSREAFLAERDAGGFALWWEAHGLLYGLPRAALEAALASGRVAVANLSRRVLPEAAARHPLRVLEITAPPAILAARLAARGRESAADVARRLSRRAPLPAGLPVKTVVNDGSVAAGAEQVVRALRGRPG